MQLFFVKAAVVAAAAATVGLLRGVAAAAPLHKLDGMMAHGR
jgi:hypothetical protein